MHLVEAVRGLVEYVNDDALSVGYAQFKESKICMKTKNTDAFHLATSHAYTDYASSLIRHQYKLYFSASPVYRKSCGQHIFTVQENEYIVFAGLSRCVCTFNNQ